MQQRSVDVVVAGHICLDMIPALHDRPTGMDSLFVPGKLVDVGPVVMSTGGAVSNTGIALHRLGAQVRLMGKVGRDPFGRNIVDIVQAAGAGLSEDMIVTDGEHSSYSIVISPPGVDRVFLHHTGTNDTFVSDDVQEAAVRQARLFHFGYPPLMRSMYRSEGAELERLFRKVKRAGLTTSLDLAKPDPASDAGKADWLRILSRTLPHVDLFLPSLEEILFMLDRAKFEQLEAAHGSSLLGAVDGDLLAWLADRLLGFGTAVAAIKLGEYGLYMRTTADRARLAAMGACAPRSPDWLNRECLTTCYRVDVAGTTGAGDCTIAGFLMGVIGGAAPHEALRGAVAVGACNVEQADATSGVPSWSDVERRLAGGWERYPQALKLEGWTWDERQAIWRGPHDGFGAEHSEMKGGDSDETK